MQREAQGREEADMISHVWHGYTTPANASRQEARRCAGSGSGNIGRRIVKNKESTGDQTSDELTEGKLFIYLVHGGCVIFPAG